MVERHLSLKEMHIPSSLIPEKMDWMSLLPKEESNSEIIVIKRAVIIASIFASGGQFFKEPLHTKKKTWFV